MNNYSIFKYQFIKYFVYFKKNKLINKKLGETIEKLLKSELSYKDGKREEYKVLN